jgi:DNA polymerase-3 subunit epsilon
MRWRRWRWRRRADAALREFWAAPLPSQHADWRQTRFLVLDAEMSSLDPEQGELLSLGWVEVNHGAIVLASARHLVIRPRASVGQSATIHHLRDCEVAAGITVEQALTELLAVARGKLLVFHHAPLDLAYLDHQCLVQHGAPLCQPYLCTLQMEKRLLERRDQLIRAGDLTLANSRRRYHLPEYHAHSALWDALATAELLLAQATTRSGGGGLSLGELAN